MPIDIPPLPVGGDGPGPGPPLAQAAGPVSVSRYASELTDVATGSAYAGAQTYLIVTLRWSSPPEKTHETPLVSSEVQVLCPVSPRTAQLSAGKSGGLGSPHVWIPAGAETVVPSHCVAVIFSHASQ